MPLTATAPDSPTATPRATSADVADRTLSAGEAAEVLDTIADLIDRGSPRAARQRMTWLARQVDDPTRWLLVQCLQALEAPGLKSRTARLDYLFTTTDVVGRALVTACLPHTDPRRPQPSAATPQPEPRVVERAPREHRSRRVAPAGPRRTDRQAANLAGTARYFERPAESGHGLDDADDDPREDTYDRTDEAELAVPPFRGTACVSCFLERSVADRRRALDDGLCEICRESGRPGIPAPATPRTREDAVIARCRFLVERAAHPPLAITLMRREWRSAPQRDRVVIVSWVQDQPSLAALLTA